jgi:uncharacterized protein YjbI with pentapeptide repeats
MCSHSYTADHFAAQRSIGRRCPYPEFYERVRSTASKVAEPERTLILPMDNHGLCIFHSQEIAWKRANNFGERFLEVVQWLNAEGADSDFDFAEFVFVGSELRKKSGSDQVQQVLLVTNLTFRKKACFTGASFHDSVAIEDVNFAAGADFNYAVFSVDLSIERSRFRGADFSKAHFAHYADFNNIEFLDYALFGDARFTGSDSTYAVKFEESRFEGITDFSGAVFALGDQSSVGFLQVRFEDVTNFTNTRFNCHTEFSDVCFVAADFIDTSFASTHSTRRYRGAAVEFNRLSLPANAILTFMSTSPQNKMFNHDVQISFKEDPAGTIRFENVNFNNIGVKSRDRLTRLAKLGRVEIGSGCIKYRFQTELRTLSVSEGNVSLILELCQTFTNYFTVSNGLNLGFEIVERDKKTVRFFYFTDEDISEEAFFERLRQTERDLWNLLSIKSDAELLALERPAGSALSTGRESALINAVDGVSAMLGTFFRVGARIVLGAWKEADTKALLGAIRFNDESANHRAVILHQLLVERYTGEILFGINGRQNDVLTPMIVRKCNLPPSQKVKILFLDANSSGEPLELEKEVRKIQTSLKLAKERDNLELKQEWAVTVESLMQAMLDESPTIVHFSGHGDESGIVLGDEMGEPRPVSANALSNLFKLFKDSVQCVVLNSCYSEHQARVIRRHIPYVIGMRSSILDTAAIAFSTGFYKALGAGKDIPFAFEMGKASVEMEGVSGESVLVLL